MTRKQFIIEQSARLHVAAMGCNTYRQGGDMGFFVREATALADALGLVDEQGDCYTIPRAMGDAWKKYAETCSGLHGSEIDLYRHIKQQRTQQETK